MPRVPAASRRQETPHRIGAVRLSGLAQAVVNEVTNQLRDGRLAAQGQVTQALVLLCR